MYVDKDFPCPQQNITMKVCATVFVSWCIILLSVSGWSSAQQGRRNDGGNQNEESGTASSEVKLQCRSRDDKVVDWWLMYKPSIGSYAEFLYFDSNADSDDKNPFLGVTSLTDASSPLTTTFSPLAESRVGSNVTYFGYSNEMNRLLDMFPLRGHSPVSNGFLAVDSSSARRGFWLVHNDIYFPPSSDGRVISNPDNWGWIESAKDIQLTYLCISIQKRSNFTTLIDFLQQLNPFTYLERISRSTPKFIKSFLRRTNDTAGQIYLTSVFKKYKTCLESIPGDRAYNECLKSSEITTAKSGSFSLLSRNKGTVGDICLDVSNPPPRLRKSLLPPLRNFNGIFAVVGENPQTYGVVCIGDMENTVVLETQTNTQTLFAGETTDFILQKLISARNTSAIDKYGGVSGGLVCFNHEVLWDTLLSADLYMEGNCLDSIDDIKNSDQLIRTKRMKRKSTYMPRLDEEPKPAKKPKMTTYPEGDTEGDTDMSTIEEEISPPRISCFALHCDKYDDYAWLIYKPPVEHRDVQVVILQDSRPPHTGGEMKKVKDGHFVIRAGFGDIQPTHVRLDHGELDIKIYKNVFEAPFNFDEVDYITNEYWAIRIDNMKPGYRTVHVQYRFSMTEVGDPYFEKLKKSDTFDVTSTSNFEDFQDRVLENNEIPMCFDWCPLEGCSYKILKRNPNVEEVKYELLDGTCNLKALGFSTDGSPPDTLINTARHGGCTHKMFRTYQCLIYETTDIEKQCQQEVEVVGFGAKEYPIEPLSNTDVDYTEEEMQYLQYRFCQSNIIQYLFYGAPWEKDTDQVPKTDDEKLKRRSTPDREKRRVVNAGVDVADCDRFFAGDSWPVKVTNSPNTDIVRICQTCRRPAANANDYCFATLYNKQLRLPEYSAYAISSYPDRSLPATIKYKRTDLKGDATLWNRFEVGLCKNNAAPGSPLVHVAGDAACDNLGSVTVRSTGGPAAANVKYHTWAGLPGAVAKSTHTVACTGSIITKAQCIDQQQASSEFATANTHAGYLYDRGHLTPSGIMNDELYKMGATFTVTNAAAQIGVDFNQREWQLLECLLRTYVWYMRQDNTGALLHSDIYLITGTRPNTVTNIPGTALTDPEYYWTAMCDPERRVSVAFMGTNANPWPHPSRITTFGDLTEFQDWLWGAGTDKEIFPGKFADCILHATTLNLQSIPLTMSCYNPAHGLPHAINMQTMSNRWRVVILLDRGVRVVRGFLNRVFRNFF